VVALGLMRDGAFVRAARRFEAWLYRQAWRVCGATQGVVDGIVSKGAALEKVRLLPNGVDTVQFQARPYQPVEGAPRTFVYAGTHGYAHGVEVILRAAELLRAEPAIRFLLVGGGADKPRLQALAAELQLPNVRFLDPIPQAEVPALLTQAYAALVTVAAGDFFAGTRSAKLFPAMAAGRAIVHSGAGEGAELVRRSNSGIVTPPADAPALAAAIRHLVHEPAATAALGANGRAFVEREYSWSAIVDRFLQDLERVHAPLG
jgi:colanic acid biosynthesis glycosyl transferase WcaI